MTEENIVGWVEEAKEIDPWVFTSLALPSVDVGEKVSFTPIYIDINVNAPMVEPIEYTDIMIDCETLGLGKRPYIVEIGVVAFNRDLPIAEEYEAQDFYARIDPKAPGNGDITPSTVYWWMDQGAQAISRVFLQEGERVTLEHALRELAIWLKPLGSKVRIIANPSHADITWLESHYEALGMPVPWTYSQVRCDRTMREDAYALGFKSKQTATGVEHSALDDALNQANLYSEIWQWLKNK